MSPFWSQHVTLQVTPFTPAEGHIPHRFSFRRQPPGIPPPAAVAKRVLSKGGTRAHPAQHCVQACIPLLWLCLAGHVAARPPPASNGCTSPRTGVTQPGYIQAARPHSWRRQGAASPSWSPLMPSSLTSGMWHVRAASHTGRTACMYTPAASATAHSMMPARMLARAINQDGADYAM
jgi:hypothetical protein